jgi:predicted nucleic acid-binding protein
LRILLDTSALSELFRDETDAKLTTFILRIGADNTFVSAITIGEIDYGIRILPSGKKRGALERWFARLLTEYRDRILDITRETSLHWSAIRSNARRRGRVVGDLDGLIAASAAQHDLVVVTRNVGDFLATGVDVFDPWQ